LHQTPNLDHEYLPIQGSDSFLKSARDLILGESLSSKSNVISFQTISGTGANHVGAQFLAQHLRPHHVFISNPTWGNHHLIWTVAAPNVIQKTYPYYNSATRSLDFDAWVARLESEAVENDVVILHACAHNPTGIDPSHSQWEILAQLFKRKKLFAFFDSAYQGFATGDLDMDAWAVRHFQQVLLGSESGASAPGLCIAQSFAKNFGLYGERVGAFHLSLSLSASTSGAYSQMLRLTRAEISNPPLFGARIVQAILSDADLRAQWVQGLQRMSSRIRNVRSLLRKEIEQRPESGDWSHLESQIGMFSYTGLTEEQVLRLKEVHHVYLMRNGRASLSGVNQGNVKYVAEAISEVISH
jgi:aspartate aminotransferase